MKSEYKLPGFKIFVAIVIFLIAALNVCRVQASDMVKLKNGTMQINANKLSVQISFGYRGYVKYGKKMKVCAVINNEGKRFSGKFRLTYQAGKNNDLKMIQKSFVVEEQESHKVQFTIPMISESRECVVAVFDNEGKTVFKAYTEIEADIDTTGIYVGMLSDTPGKLGYIADSLETADEFESSDAVVTGKVFEMSASDFETQDMLDTVDIIVLDNYNTGRFSRHNIKVLKNWIAEGGTLVVGTGSNYQKEFEKLHSTLLKGYIGKTERISTDFGWRHNDELNYNYDGEIPESIDIDVVNLRLNEDMVLIEDGRKLMVSKNYGEGSIIVAEFSLNLPKKVWSSYGQTMMSVIEENLSEGTKKKLLMQNENVLSQDSEYSYLDEALKINENDVLPNMSLYGCILGIYIIIAGPGLYFFFRRRRNREYLWIAIPVLSVAFSAIIYIVGTSTRIQRPYINYLSQIILSDNQKTKTKNMSTLFSVTSVSNDAYSMNLNGKYYIVPRSIDTYSNMSNMKDAYISDYSYGVEYGENNTKLLMNKMSSFQNADFVMQQKIKSQGSVDINVSENDMFLTGTVSNRLGFDLNNCMIFYQGNLLYIGDIEAGENIDVEKIAKSNTFNNSEYGDSNALMIENAMGGNMYSNSVAVSLRRKIGVVEEYLDDNTNAEAWFYGFAKDGSVKSFTNKFNYDLYGVTGVCKNFELDEKINGYEVIDSLETYALKYDSEYTNGYEVYTDAPEQFSVTYRFPESFVLRELLYSKNTSDGVEFFKKSTKYGDYGFFGTVSVKNKQTDKLETLFTSGNETNIKNMADYLEDDGSLTLYYSVEHKSENEIGTLCLPTVKLAGDYVEDKEEFYDIMQKAGDFSYEKKSKGILFIEE